MQTRPKISCLCVTNNRVEMLDRAIKCFLAQTYENKELFIVHLASDSATAKYLSSLPHAELKSHAVEDKEGLTLGDLRNISIEKSSGEYFCVWDDDDWSSKDRLKYQYEAMVSGGKRVSILRYIVMFDVKANQAYLSTRRPWENTLLCEKKLLKEYSLAYPSLNRGEDTDLVRKMMKAKQPSLLSKVIRPQLYVYCVTGSNTCDSGHFESLYELSDKLSAYHSTEIQKILSDEVDHDEAAATLSSEKFLTGLPQIVDDKSVVLDRATETDIPVLANLYELNAHDLSNSLSLDIDANGFYKSKDLSIYWSQPDRRFPFLIRYRNGIAGFALVSHEKSDDDERGRFTIDEFFILRKLRLTGLGTRAAFLLWDLFGGSWTIRVPEKNRDATLFWKQCVLKYSNGSFLQSTRTVGLRAWREYAFSSTRSDALGARLNRMLAGRTDSSARILA
jgi:predicted acetyltransferase